MRSDKIYGKNNFFGEAGIRMKHYAFVDKMNFFQSNLNYEFNSFYGAIGLDDANGKAFTLTTDVELLAREVIFAE